MKAKWTLLTTSSSLQRSSHTVAVINNQIYIYGGELRPIEPVDGEVYVVRIDKTSSERHPGLTGEVDTTTLTAPAPGKIPATSTSPSPQPRVGAASTTLNGKIYVFSGRGGVDMRPLQEEGVVHVFATSPSADKGDEGSWSRLSPASGSQTPEGRSYHALTSNNHDTLYLHAGCPATGRLQDLWAFNVNQRTWKRLADAPSPPRGGPSIAYLNGKVYRMNGFDGKSEIGGTIDVYDLERNSWTTASFEADGRFGPTKRSVACLLPLELEAGGKKKACLITMFGESDPSNLGHQGAGKMLGDAWAYDIDEGKWESIEWEGKGPESRGWFDADVWRGGEGGRQMVVVGGGLSQSNERLGDIWVMDLFSKDTLGKE